MKRKADDEAVSHPDKDSKRPTIEIQDVSQRFRTGLFKSETVAAYKSEYAESSPYRHAVVSELIEDSLLRSVRSEIVQNIHFSPKETDIYKIHQSGDLANLDGLAASALDRLPSLLKLRDALYSFQFRQWLAHITGCGALSGKKTDMAVNLYVPGCHLLCHDDVIGSRRVSYILYLTDPDKPWKAEWGGALRLYPTDEVQDSDGHLFRLPQSEWNKSIPPAWNQLSFFEVQPGESFHDVEEVYTREEGGSENDGGRFRMAISGWFHIPQEGEEGHEPGLEERMAERSSLQQLQGKADQLDWPLPILYNFSNSRSQADGNGAELQAEDLELLVQYMTPNYLTPDIVDELFEIFEETSTLQLADFLAPKLAERLKHQILEGDAAVPTQKFQTSRPPHKHRYQYIQSRGEAPRLDAYADNPFEAVLTIFLPSKAFATWLSLVTGLSLARSSTMARRFRRGLDYQLAQEYTGDEAQLEFCLCATPSVGWGGDSEQKALEAWETNGTGKGKGKAKQVDQGEASNGNDEDNVGGYELYMAGDDHSDDEDGASENGVDAQNPKSQTGAGDRRSSRKAKADPAIYRAAEDDQDDGILLSLPASWNTLNLSLVDKGTLRFVKYVSRSAPGDRYDFSGSFEVDPEDDAIGESEDDDNASD